MLQVAGCVCREPGNNESIHQYTNIPIHLIRFYRNGFDISVSRTYHSWQDKSLRKVNEVSLEKKVIISNNFYEFENIS